MAEKQKLAEHEEKEGKGKLRDDNVALFRRYIELENARNYKELEKLFHPTEFRCQTWFGNHPIAPESLSRMLRGLFSAFPDWHMTVNEIIAADENAVVGRITGRGTQHTAFMNRPASDQQIAIPLIHCIRVAKGKIVEYRATSPFENPFASEIIAPDDVQAARAQQGHDSGGVQDLLDAAQAAGHIGKADVAKLQAVQQSGANKCQSLLPGSMRRCTNDAMAGKLYCAHHQSHGYGVDGVE